MQSIASLFESLEKPVVNKNGPKVDFEFQALGIEMVPHYGKKVWSLFYKFPLWKIKEAWRVAQSKGNFEFGYLIGIINHL